MRFLYYFFVNWLRVSEYDGQTIGFWYAIELANKLKGF